MLQRVISPIPPPAVAGRAATVRGFTMIELIVTMALMAILLGFAVPSMQRLLGGSQLASQVNELVFALQTARSEAIKRAAPVVLCASDDSLDNDPNCNGAGFGDGWIVFADDNVNGARDPGEEVILQAEPPGGTFAFTADPTVAARVLFVDSGGSATTAGTPVSGDILIEHSADGKRRRVSIGANGRITSGEAP